MEIDTYYQQYSPIDIEFDSRQENTLWYCGQISNNMAVSWTDNYGYTWNRMILSPLASEALAVEIDPQNSDFVWVAGTGATQSFVYKTVDGGDTWQISSVPGESGSINDLQIHPEDSGTVFIAAENGVYKSMNSGSTWELCLNKPSSALLIDPVNPLRIYISTEGFGVWISHDCGEQWEELGEGLTDPVGNDLALYPGKWLFVATAGSGIFRYDLDQLGFGRGDPWLDQPMQISAPSPVCGTVVFNLELPECGFASLEVYDMTGHLMATPLNTQIPAGSSSVCWIPEEKTPRGFYMYKFESDGSILTGKVILIE